MKWLGFFALTASALAQPRVVELPGKSPLVTIRLVFTTGAASNPADKPGVANLTAEMIGGGGTKELTHKQVVDAMYPMAASVEAYSDKEMTTFVGQTHVDNLDQFYALMRDLVLKPGWRADDFTRLRDNTISALKVSLRGNNDEELGKEELYALLYKNHPYGQENLGTLSALSKMTVADLQAFYATNYTQSNLMIGLAGGYPPAFLARVKKDFAALPAGKRDRVALPAPAPLKGNQLTLVTKDTRSVAWSLGFPIDVKRGDPDYAALLVMQSWFGQHRSKSHLFDRMREERGLNYGDYAYIEYFPQGMFRFDPQPNIARRQQIFQIWIRPVEPMNAAFSLRLAMFELDKLVRQGMTQADFDRTKAFLSKYVNVLTKDKSDELGYAMDSAFYGIPDYNQYVKTALEKLRLADVNQAIRKHLRTTDVQIVGIAKDTAALKAALTGDAPTPITYNSPKPEEIVAEDKLVEKFPLGIRDVNVVPVESVFDK